PRYLLGRDAQSSERRAGFASLRSEGSASRLNGLLEFRVAFDAGVFQPLARFQDRPRVFLAGRLGQLHARVAHHDGLLDPDLRVRLLLVLLVALGIAEGPVYAGDLADD